MILCLPAVLAVSYTSPNTLACVVAFCAVSYVGGLFVSVVRLSVLLCVVVRSVVSVGLPRVK